MENLSVTTGMRHMRYPIFSDKAVGIKFQTFGPSGLGASKVEVTCWFSRRNLPEYVKAVHAGMV